ncbi:MAG: hypothetical protein CR987_00490, partial [Draconibacterium sp.]
TAHEYKANLAKGILENNGIKVVVMNQQDTAYKVFGEFVVYVEEENKAKAEELLTEFKH